MAHDPLCRAIDAAGGPAAFCAALKISSRTLYDWRKRGVPDTRAHEAAAASRGLVSAGELAQQRVALLAPAAPPEARVA